MKKYIYTIGAIAMLGLLLLVSGIFTRVEASPSYFPPPVKTSTATTSPVYMTPGTATSTLTFDSYYQSTLSQNTKTDSAVLLTQFAGISLTSVLAINVEYSEDGVDYYKDDLNSFSATTSPTTSYLNANNTFTWTFASSTPGGAGVTAATGATSTKAINIPTPTRFMRVIYSITGANGAVWGELVPTKEMK